MAARLPGVKARLVQGADLTNEWRRVLEDWEKTLLRADAIYEKLSNLAEGKAVATGTKTPTLGGNAPIDGGPSKWIAVDDDGTTRYFPLW